MTTKKTSEVIIIPDEEEEETVEERMNHKYRELANDLVKYAMHVSSLRNADTPRRSRPPFKYATPHGDHIKSMIRYYMDQQPPQHVGMNQQPAFTVMNPQPIENYHNGIGLANIEACVSGGFEVSHGIDEAKEKEEELDLTLKL
ncbi:hypothetical protein FCV25MIE_15713 [Fagus crenata]